MRRTNKKGAKFLRLKDGVLLLSGKAKHCVSQLSGMADV